MPPPSKFYLPSKRALDILASTTGLLLLSPLFLIIILSIVIDSPGGAFFLQQRVGKSGKIFRMYKFRSMRLDADIRGLLTVGNDARITRTGRILRKYKLDELPQLLNVLIGNMSLVGPRPEVQKYVDLYSPEQRDTLMVKPGITDWASLKYRHENQLLAYSADPEKEYIERIMPDKLSINLEYIRNRSFFTDLKIIVTTIIRITK